MKYLKTQTELLLKIKELIGMKNSDKIFTTNQKYREIFKKCF